MGGGLYKVELWPKVTSESYDSLAQPSIGVTALREKKANIV
jgi:hypothetical protein